jgi:hypothetical protein
MKDANTSNYFYACNAAKATVLKSLLAREETRTDRTSTE